MTSTLMVFQIILAIVITIAILLQKSSSIGLGAYSGSNESLFGAKGPTGFLAKLTFTLGLVFVINTLVLGYLYNKESKSSVTDKIVEQKKAPAPFVPSQPALPTSPPAAPAAPSVPVTNK